MSSPPQNIRTIFMGSPEFALPTLQALVTNYKVVGVVTQPDRPAGRGKAIVSPPVKNLAIQLGLELIQPQRLKEPWALQQLRDWQPDLIVVAAFGQILRSTVLDLPHYGCINVHASLLPRWRGAAPIQAAILAGDSLTGVSIMKMDPGIDTGPILKQMAVEINANDTATSLGTRLAQAGANLLVETLTGYLSGKLIPEIQNDALATYAPILKKEDGLLDFTLPAEMLSRQVRAYNPWPGAYTLWQGQMLKIHAAHAMYGDELNPGVTGIREGFPVIGTVQGQLIIDIVQPSGKKAMPGSVFLQGARNWMGSILRAT